jgi:hypothetical protein
MDTESLAREAAPVQAGEERHTRHRYIEQLYIGKQDGTWFTAMTFEISAGGLSAATKMHLNSGKP